MTVNPQLLSAYRYHRDHLARGGNPPPSTNSFRLGAVYASLHRTAPALMALIHARADLAAGKPRYYSRPGNDRANGYWKGRGTDRMQWIERPEAIGLRKVDYCDQIYKYIDHTGWFTDEDGREKIRGIVYQLPARNGIPQFVAGFDDPDNEGTAAIDFGTIYRGERSQDSDPSSQRAAKEAAKAADALAESEAEGRRDYDRAWQAGRLWAELGEEIDARRASLKAMLAERREAKHVGGDLPAICQAIREYVEDALEFVRESRDKRKDLANGDYDEGRCYYGFYTGDPDLRGAFNDGAGQGVLA